MTVIPDIIGLPLDKALEICKNLGYEVDIKITRPVKARQEGALRAVRFDKVSKYRGVVTVVFEDTGRGGG
ncbi:hypothetical protein [Pelotomaculum propionicicum]|uniref:PASTA domain-containing protein n=1 Tax=Pelotomaculum propionicicum TaxID=258475 RepID=A0A4Y7RMG4_9FIRM|nr:hypothetical protein [Pelotomaculum propionicicum]NLI11953.1 hypothetical protein [Peptococcaceae bacterium]TEB10165.1 hypothetical protein Pmgp_02570 [Pelotomaculum propionicicum]